MYPDFHVIQKGLVINWYKVYLHKVLLTAHEALDSPEAPMTRCLGQHGWVGPCLFFFSALNFLLNLAESRIYPYPSMYSQFAAAEQHLLNPFCLFSVARSSPDSLFCPFSLLWLLLQWLIFWATASSFISITFAASQVTSYGHFKTQCWETRKLHWVYLGNNLGGLPLYNAILRGMILNSGGYSYHLVHKEHPKVIVSKHALFPLNVLHVTSMRIFCF